MKDKVTIGNDYRVKVVEHDTGLYIVGEGKTRSFCNAHFHPFEKIIFMDGGDEEVYNCKVTLFFDDDPDDFEEIGVSLSNEDLTNVGRLARISDHIAVSPFAQYMAAFKMYIMKKFRKLKREGKARVKKGVRSSGVVYNPDTEKLEYCINNYSNGDIVAQQQVPILSRFYTKKLSHLDNVSEYMKDIIGLHYDYITVTILCWSAAVMAKGFSTKSVKNPALFSHGVNNSGKSALHKNIIGRLFDFKSSVMTHRESEPEQLFCSGQTPATLQRHGSASNVIPLLLDEFKYFRDTRLREMLSNFIRNAYDMTTVSKGIDYSASMQHYTIIRPLALTGESNFGDEQAIINRQIVIQHRRFSKEHQNRFRNFDFSKMKNLGYMMFDMLFKEQNITWKKYSNQKYEELNIDSRNYENIDFLYNGMQVINELCNEAVITEDMFENAVDHYVSFILSEDVSDVEEALTILNDFIRVQDKDRSFRGTQNLVDMKDNKLYIVFFPVYDELRRINLMNRKRDLTEILGKAGLSKHKNVSNKDMNGWRGHIYEFVASDFFSKIHADRYPYLFGDLDLDSKQESLNDIQIMMYE